MPGSKEIRNKIKSVQNTRKITKAMEMVAASKMRRAQERMRHARPYGEKIRNVAAHMRLAEPTTASLTPTGTWDYIYEPDAESVLTQVLTRYVEALIYQAVAENMASEQS